MLDHNREHRTRAEIARFGLLDSQRIGDDERWQANNRLIEFSVAGFLSDEEFEARVIWVQNSKTRRELDVAFSDLPRVMVFPAKPVPKLPYPVRWVYFSVVSLWFAFMIALDTYDQQYWATALVTVLLLAWIYVVVRIRRSWKKKNH